MIFLLTALIAICLCDEKQYGYNSTAVGTANVTTVEAYNTASTTNSADTECKARQTKCAAWKTKGYYWLKQGESFQATYYVPTQTPVGYGTTYETNYNSYTYNSYAPSSYYGGYTPAGSYNSPATYESSGSWFTSWIYGTTARYYGNPPSSSSYSYGGGSSPSPSPYYPPGSSYATTQGYNTPAGSSYSYGGGSSPSPSPYNPPGSSSSWLSSWWYGTTASYYGNSPSSSPYYPPGSNYATTHEAGSYSNGGYNSPSSSPVNWGSPQTGYQPTYYVNNAVTTNSALLGKTFVLEPYTQWCGQCIVKLVITTKKTATPDLLQQLTLTLSYALERQVEIRQNNDGKLNVIVEARSDVAVSKTAAQIKSLVLKDAAVKTAAIVTFNAAQNREDEEEATEEPADSPAFATHLSLLAIASASIAKLLLY